MPKTSRYAKLDTETFDRLLREVINADNPSACDVLNVPGVYEILSDHYNNDVLSAYREEQETDADADADNDQEQETDQ